MENLTIPENTTLVTMDITFLYMNIPHDDGIAACRKIWEQRTVQEPPTECLVEMLTLVLKNNNFTLDGYQYLQINGTVMGTKMTPSYANILLGDQEERLLLLSLKQALSWFRFIDDVDMKCIHSFSPSSCHPKHCFKSIPFSQAIRVKRICSTVETTKQRL
jgi:hypothetical protein